MIDNLIPIVISVLGGGGLVGGIYALLKLRPEAGQIVVMAAQGALIVQTGVLDTLTAENKRLQARIDALEEEVHQLRAEIRQLRVGGS